VFEPVGLVRRCGRRFDTGRSHFVVRFSLGGEFDRAVLALAPDASPVPEVLRNQLQFVRFETAVDDDLRVEYVRLRFAVLVGVRQVRQGQDEVVSPLFVIELD